MPYKPESSFNNVDERSIAICTSGTRARKPFCVRLAERRASCPIFSMETVCPLLKHPFAAAFFLVTIEIDTREIALSEGTSVNNELILGLDNFGLEHQFAYKQYLLHTGVCMLRRMYNLQFNYACMYTNDDIILMFPHAGNINNSSHLLQQLPA